jgi:hypothetical protein
VPDRLKQRAMLIKAIAEFIVEDAAMKSIALELALKIPPQQGMPRWAHHWRRVCTLAGVRGYASVEEAERVLQELL